MLPTPKTLIFDVGGVIVPLNFPRAYSRMEQLCGIPAAEIPKRIAATGLVPRLERGLLEPRPFAEQLLDALGIDGPYEQFQELWSAIFDGGPILQESLFAGLRGKHRLMLLSNTNAIHYEMLERQYPVLQLFDERVLSHQVGFAKPSPEIYRAAIERSGCGAGECFFTDDIPAYVEAARTEGMDAVQFISPEQLERELHVRGIGCTTGI